MKHHRRPAARRAERGSTLRRALTERTVSSARTRIAELATRMRDRSEQMHEASTTRRGTRRRALLPVVGGLAALAGMFQLVSANVLAVNFNTTSTPFKLYSNYLDAQQAAGFLAPTTKASGTQEGVADLGIKSAKLAGLCAIATESIGPLGAYSLMITAGDPVPDSYAAVSAGTTSVTVGDGASSSATVTTKGGTGSDAGQLSGSSLTNAIQASFLYVNSNSLGGFGNQISGLNLGESADKVSAEAGLTGAGTAWPNANGGSAPTAGNFGLYASQLNVAGLGAQTYGLNLAGNITLPKLSIKVVPSAKAQADCS